MSYKSNIKFISMKTVRHFIIYFCIGLSLLKVSIGEDIEKENTDNNPYEFHIGGVLSNNDSKKYFKQTIEQLNFNVPFVKPGNKFYAHSITMDPNLIKISRKVCKELIARQVYAIIMSQTQIEDDESPKVVSHLGGFYHIPVIDISYRDDSTFSDKNTHVLFLRTMPPYSHQAEAWVELLKYFNYLKVIFIKSSDYDGRSIVHRFQTTLQNQGEDIEKKVQVEAVINFKPGLFNFNNQLKEMKKAQARVYLMYASKIDAEVIFRDAAQRNMTKAGYVWIVTEQALDAVNVPEGTIGLKLINASNELAHIYDSVYILASAIMDMNRTKTITTPPDDCDSVAIWDKGKTFFEFIKKQVYEDGHTGKVAFDNNGDRIYAEYDIVNVKQVAYKDAIGKYYFDNDLSKMKLRLNEYNIIWPGRLTKKPNGFMIPRHLKILTIEAKPFVYVRPLKTDEGNSCESDEIVCSLYNTSSKEPQVFCCKGYCIDLLVELSKTMNFTYSLSLSPDGQFGDYEIRNTSVTGKKYWNGLIGELVYKRADMIIAPLTINSEREEFIDFSIPFMYQGITILEKMPSRSSTLVSFLQPFSNNIWVLIFVALHVGSIVLYLLDRLSPFARLNADSTEEPALSFSSALWFMWGVLLNNVIGEGTPKSISAKVFGMVWAGFSMICVALYTANLAALLMLQRPNIKLSGINDVRVRSVMGNLTCATVKGSAVDMYLRRQVELSNMYRKMEANNYETAEDAIRDVKNDKLNAFIWDSSRLEFEAAQDCQLVTAGELFGRFGYGVGLQKGSPWLESVTSSILNFQESGFMKSLEDKWIYQGRVEQCEDQEKTLHTLGLKNMAGLFILVPVGIFIGMERKLMRIQGQSSGVGALSLSVEALPRSNICCSEYSETSDVADNLSKILSNMSMFGLTDGLQKERRHSF